MEEKLRCHPVSCLPAGHGEGAPGALAESSATKPGRVITALAAVLLGPPWLQGARVPQSSHQATVRFAVEVNYVEVYALVEDGPGGFVGELTPQEFALYEEGERQSISRFSGVDLPPDRPRPPQHRPGGNVPRLRRPPAVSPGNEQHLC